MKNYRLIELTTKKEMEIVKRCLEKTALYDKLVKAYPAHFEQTMKDIANDTRDLLSYMVEALTGEHPAKELVCRQHQAATRKPMLKTWAKRKGEE
jgi:hypothetical protein